MSFVMKLYDFRGIYRFFRVESDLILTFGFDFCSNLIVR